MSPFGVVSVNEGQSPILRLLTPGLDALPARVLRFRGDWERVALSDVEGEGVVPYGVTGSETDPLRDGSVLLLSSGELDLCAEGLVALEGTMSVCCSLMFYRYFGGS
jgi:hypothetical protein